MLAFPSAVPSNVQILAGKDSPMQNKGAKMAKACWRRQLAQRRFRRENRKSGIGTRFE
jgi:hypothetical protein